MQILSWRAERLKASSRLRPFLLTSAAVGALLADGSARLFFDSAFLILEPWWLNLPAGAGIFAFGWAVEPAENRVSHRDRGG